MSEFVNISRHVVEERWRDRSDQPLRDPLAVWYEAYEVDPCETDADEARYHPDAGVVFLVLNNVVTTVLSTPVEESELAAEIDAVRRTRQLLDGESVAPDGGGSGAE